MVQRNQRQRKKMRIGEFQELGFSVQFSFKEGTDVEQIDAVVDALINEVIKPNKLAFSGSGYYNWDGLVCLESIGSCTEEHRALVKAWLDKQAVEQVEVSELFDIWWG